MPDAGDETVAAETSRDDRVLVAPLASLLDSVPASMAILDAKGRILLVNQAWHRFARDNGFVGDRDGLDENYVDVCMAANAADIRYVGQGLRDVLSGRKPEFQTVYPCHAPWEVRWFRMICRPFRIADRTLYTVIHIAITEAAAIDHGAQGAGEPATGTSETDAVFDRLVEELDVGLATASGLMRLIAEETFGPVSHRPYVTNAAEAVAATETMRARLADFAVLQAAWSDRLALNPDWLSLASEIRIIADQISVLTNQRGAELRIDDGLGKWQVQADPDLFRLALTALIDNALRYSRLAGTVSVEAGGSRSGILTLQIRDQGLGIERGERMTILKPLQQGRAARKIGYHGLGLGLSLARELLERMGARLTLQSPKGGGTVVQIRWPARLVQAVGREG